MSGEQRVARAASRKEDKISGDPCIGFQTRELGVLDSLHDRQGIVHFLSDARNRILIDRVFITTYGIGHCVAPDSLLIAVALARSDDARTAVQRLNRASPEWRGLWISLRFDALENRGIRHRLFR
jgi:hypothetical protein